MHRGGSKLSGEGLYDSRLFNQTSGMDSGFGADDEYNTYSKPLFARSEVASSIYRPKGGDSDVYGDADAQVFTSSIFVTPLNRAYTACQVSGHKSV